MLAKKLEELYGKLNELGNAVIALKPDEQRINAGNQWNLASLSSRQFAFKAYEIAKAIQESDIGEISEEEELNVTRCIESIDAFRQFSLPQLFNVSNALHVVPLYNLLLEHASAVTNSLTGWSTYPTNPSKIPTKVARRLTSLNTRIEKYTVGEADIKSKIKIIDDATDAAESMPTTLSELLEAKEEIQKTSEESRKIKKDIDKHLEQANVELERLNNLKTEAEQIIEQCGVAYSAKTSMGLAASFDERAGKLNTSVGIWVFGLLASLGIAGWVGYERFTVMNNLILNINADREHFIWLEFLVSALSLGLPLWFAWLSTKQIGQRFRLSEDYAFKASVAKAYEGYRKEASRFDKTVEEQLFKSALARLDEQPLRYIEMDVYGSPLHESGAIDSLKNNLEDVKDNVLDVAKNALPKPPSQ